MLVDEEAYLLRPVHDGKECKVLPSNGPFATSVVFIQSKRPFQYSEPYRMIGNDLILFVWRG